MNSNEIDDSKPDTLTAAADTPSEAPEKPKRTRKAAAAPKAVKARATKRKAS